MPSVSWAVQTGVMLRRKVSTSRHRWPIMEPESSTKKMVSKVDRNANWSSGVLTSCAWMRDPCVSRDGVSDGSLRRLGPSADSSL